MPVSLTEVKRDRAQLQPKARSLGLWVAKPGSSDTIVINGRKLERISAFGILGKALLEIRKQNLHPVWRCERVHSGRVRSGPGIVRSLPSLFKIFL